MSTLNHRNRLLTMTALRALLLWLACFAIQNPLQAQASCASALPLTPGFAQCGDSAGQPGDFPANGDAPANPCFPQYNDDEYWFSYTPAQDDTELALQLSGLSATWAGLFLFDACPPAGACLASAYNAASTADLALSHAGLQAGQTYYIVVTSFGQPNSTAFCLSASESAPDGCAINSLAHSNIGACQPNSAQYSVDITVTYSNAPASGQLVLNGQTFAITGSPQTETLSLMANGQAADLEAYFSARPACRLSLPDAFSAPAPCAGQACAEAIELGDGEQFCGSSHGFPGEFDGEGGEPQNPCGSFYNDDELWFAYTASEDGERIQLNATGLSATWVGLFLMDGCPADGGACLRTAVNMASTADLSLLSPYLEAGKTYYFYVANYGSPDGTDFCLQVTALPSTACQVASATPGTQSACAGNDNTYSQTIDLSFVSPPGGGELLVNGQAFANSGATAQSLTLLGLAADGQPVDVAVSFADDPSCLRIFPALFTAPAACLVGDSPCDALSLAVDGQPNGPFSNRSATVDAGEVAPTGEACDEQNTWCNAGLEHSIWFKFVAPASGSVNILTEGFDTQVALWEGTCSEMLNAQARLVAANDDAGGAPDYAAQIVAARCLKPGLEYFVQVDGYNGAAGDLLIRIEDANLPSPIFTALPGACTELTATSRGRGEWINFLDDSGRVLFSLNDRGNVLGELTVTLDDMGETAASTPFGVNYVPRYVFLESATSPVSPVLLRFYFRQDELDALSVADMVPVQREALSITKYDGPDADCQLDNNDFVSGQFIHYDSEVAEWDFIVDSVSGFALEVAVPEFSEFGAANGQPLPVELLRFEGKADERLNVLFWETASEQDASHFEIERSADGRDFARIGSLAAAGNSSQVQAYRYEDRAPLPLGYYRLKQVDIGGAFTYSPIVAIERAAQAQAWQMQPNPTRGSLALSFDALPSDALLRISNIQGQVLFEDGQLPQSGSLELDLSAWPAGLYIVALRLNGEWQQRKLLKQAGQ